MMISSNINKEGSLDLSEESIDRLGFILEHGGFDDTAIDAYFLEHFGKKGMKWGVRSGKGKTGVSRVRGSVLDRNQRHTQTQLRRAKGVGGIGDKVNNAIIKTALGKGGAAKYRTTRIAGLSQQRDRITSGRTHVLDKLQTVASFQITSLAVSVTSGNSGRRSDRSGTSGLSVSPAQARAQSFTQAGQAFIRGSARTAGSRPTRGSVPGFDRPANPREVAQALTQARRDGLMD